MQRELSSWRRDVAYFIAGPALLTGVVVQTLSFNAEGAVTIVLAARSAPTLSIAWFDAGLRRFFPDPWTWPIHSA